MSNEQEHLTVGEFDRTMRRFETSNSEQFRTLRDTVNTASERLEEKLDEQAKALTALDKGHADHSRRIEALEQRPVPPVAAQIVATTHPPAASEDGVFKISASKQAWAALGAMFGILQLIVTVALKKLGWIQ